MKRSRVRLLASLLIAATLCGCGYRLVRYQGALGDARTLALSGLENRTLEPGVAGLVTDALAREFLRRGALRLVDDPASADLVLRGAVERLDTRSQSFSSVRLALEHQLTLGLDLELRRRDGQAIALDGRALTETELYLASADVEAERKNREEALRRLAALLAERAHDALVERLAP